MMRAFVVFAATLAVLAASAAALALSISGAHALTTPTSSAGAGQNAVSIAAVTALTVPPFAAAAFICIVAAPARYTDDGVTTPTSSIGIPAPVGCFAYGGPLAGFRIIGAGATMDVSYYR
jgi:hypothetical protein